MTNRKILFSPPDIREEDIEEVVATLQSGWITTGARTKEFEKRIADYTGAKKAVALNSATAALELTLRLLGIGPGDEVITTAYTYTATAAVVSHVGARLILVDTAKNSFEMDYDAVDKAITDRTKVIIPVDLGGKMCDYQRLTAIVNSRKHLFKPDNELQEVFNRIIIVADGAHSFGAYQFESGKSDFINDGLNERKSLIKSGQAADFTAFSFHAVKNLTTAEGGAVVWKDMEGIDNDWLYSQFMVMSMHGQSESAFSKSNQGKWEYDVLYPGYKCNMTDIQAALGLKQLERYGEILSKRKSIIQKYDKAFIPQGIDGLKHFGNDYASSGHLYLMRIPWYTYGDRNRMIVELADRGISANVHYKPLPLLTVYKNMGLSIKDFPNSYSQYECEISLPLHTCLTEEDVDYIIENVSDLLSKGQVLGK
ncbi:MAG: DegT/DnrJ/EryC1/StrS family aminotransferase [Lachnospira sp.]